MSEVTLHDSEKSGGNKFATFLRGLRKSGDQIAQPELQAHPETPTDTIDDQSLQYITEHMTELGLPNTFKAGINVYPFDESLDEERRYISVEYPVLRTGDKVEMGWETVIIDNQVVAFLPPQGDETEVGVKRYSLDAWLNMQKRIIDSQKAYEAQQQQLRQIGEAVAEDRYVDHLEDIEQDPEYKRLNAEAAASGDVTALRRYAHARLAERSKKELQYLPHIPDHLLGGKATRNVPYNEVVDIDRIVSVKDWDDWRGRGKGRSGKNNELKKVNYTTSGEHIAYLAEAKLFGEFGEEKDTIQLESVYAKDGTYYRVIRGGHRIASDKLLGGKAAISAEVVSGRVYDGNFGDTVKQVTKERIAHEYVVQTNRQLRERQVAKAS